MARQKSKLCPGCHTLFKGKDTAKTCSARCRKRLHRAQQSLHHEVQRLAQSSQTALTDIQNSLIFPQPSEAGFIDVSYADTQTPAALHPVGHIITPQPPTAPTPLPSPQPPVQTLNISQPAPAAQPLTPQPLTPTPTPQPLSPGIQSLETKPTTQHWQALQNSWQLPSVQPPAPSTPLATPNQAPAPPLYQADSPKPPKFLLPPPHPAGLGLYHPGYPSLRSLCSIRPVAR